MKKLLILSPCFPPTDSVEMHRVRMNVGHYRDMGWEPTVLAVKPELAGKPVDERLLDSLPDNLRIVRCGAIREKWARWFGISAVGLRALRSLTRAGDELLAEESFDLVFISTTAFPTMTLGRRWKRKFGVPFVLDFQDPWYTAPAQSQAFRRKGLKHRVMRGLHRWLEARAVPDAAGLIAVSSAYIDALQGRYQELKERPAKTIPFGWSLKDLALSERLGVALAEIKELQQMNKIAALYAGRVTDNMQSALSALLQLIKFAPDDGPLSKLHLLFLGTGYMKSGNPEVVTPTAKTAGVRGQVTEIPDRIPLLDALASLQTVDVLIMLGSDDLAYQPSKLHQYFAMGKPMIVLAPGGGLICEQVAKQPGVVFVESDKEVDSKLAAEIDQVLTMVLSENINPLQHSEELPGEASHLARQEMNLFRLAIA